MPCFQGECIKYVDLCLPTRIILTHIFLVTGFTPIKATSKVLLQNPDIKRLNYFTTIRKKKKNLIRIFINKICILIPQGMIWDTYERSGNVINIIIAKECRLSEKGINRYRN